MDKISLQARLSPQGAQAVASDAQAAGKLENLAHRSIKNEKDLEKATSGFESLLLGQMLKSMWETVDTTGLLGEDSNQAQIYRDMLNEAISDKISEGKGIGVKKFLSRELKKMDKASNDQEGDL